MCPRASARPRVLLCLGCLGVLGVYDMYLRV